MSRYARSASTRWWTLSAVSLTQLLIVLDGTIINVALPWHSAAASQPSQTHSPGQ